jgi:hypothetical protein
MARSVFADYAGGTAPFLKRSIEVFTAVGSSASLAPRGANLVHSSSFSFSFSFSPSFSLSFVVLGIEYDGRARARGFFACIKKRKRTAKRELSALKRWDVNVTEGLEDAFGSSGEIRLGPSLDVTHRLPVSSPGLHDRHTCRRAAGDLVQWPQSNHER